jgi:hypothetical protein
MPGFFDWLETHGDQLLALAQDALQHAYPHLMQCKSPNR